MSSSTYRILGAVLGVAAGVAAIAMGFYVHGVSGYRLGLAWHLGVVISAPRLLVAMGVVMIIGGLLTLRFVVLGGILTALPLVAGLAFAYQHEWYRMANLHVWAVSVVLALLSCVCAGLALQQEIVPVGAQPTGAPLVPPPAPSQVPPTLPPPPLDDPAVGIGVTPSE
jgi:hypothetical protein